MNYRIKDNAIIHECGGRMQIVKPVMKDGKAASLEKKGKPAALLVCNKCGEKLVRYLEKP